VIGVVGMIQSSATSTRSVNEMLLDHFPVSETELEGICLVFSLSQLQSLLLGGTEAQLINGSNIAKDLRLSDLRRAVPSGPVTDANLGATTDEMLTKLEYVEQHLLPELIEIFCHTLRSVFVLDLVSEADGCDEPLSLMETARLLETFVSLCGRRSSHFLMKTLFDAVLDQDGSAIQGQGNHVASVEALASLLHRFAVAYEFLASTKDAETVDRITPYSTETPLAWIDSLSSSISNNKISNAEWRDWVNKTCPNFSLFVASVWHIALIPTHLSEASRQPSFRSVTLDSPSSILLQHTRLDRVTLAAMTLDGPWKRLYSSALKDGLSFLTLQQALWNYVGPTVLLIQSTGGARFGYFTQVPWKSSTKWFGASPDGPSKDAFLFALEPSWQLYSRIGDSYWQYLHVPSRSRQGILSGLAVGGVAEDSPRLHITATLEGCRACTTDTTFESGPLLGAGQDFTFDIEAMEVWAVQLQHSTDFPACQAEGEMRASIREETRLRFAQVDKSQFVEDFSSGAFMNHVYQHRAQTRGRADFVAADTGELGYYVEDKAPSVPSICDDDYELDFQNSH
jgi:hypothetical protein